MTKKKRNMHSIIEFDTPVQADSVMYRNGRIEVLKDGGVVYPDRGQIRVSYDRPKGAKLLNATPVGVNTILDPNLSLTNYHQLVAVDTNTKPFGDSTISVAGITIGRCIENKDNSINFSMKPAVVYEYRGLNVEVAERYVWRKLLKDLENEEWLTNKNIAIVVDSALSCIRDINDRKCPVYEDYYLRDGISIIYATSDSGAEYAANKMIKLCDKIANINMRRIINDSELSRGAHLVPDSWGNMHILWE